MYREEAVGQVLKIEQQPPTSNHHQGTVKLAIFSDLVLVPL